MKNFFIILVVCFCLFPLLANNSVEAKPIDDPDWRKENARQPIINNFASSLKTGDPNTVVGIWSDKFALPVDQQPMGDNLYVTADDSKATQFRAPFQSFGSYVFLAHNFRAGRYFNDVQVGDDIVVIFGDGSTKSFTITQIDNLHVLIQNSPISDMADEAGNQYSSGQVYQREYGDGSLLVLQTCISIEGNVDWGSKFVIAKAN